MATSITSVTDEIAEYLSKNFNAEDEFLRQLREEALEQDIPAINISGEQGAFLQLFLMATKAKLVIEIGSLAGYSAILLARALPEDGKIICIEMNEDYCDFIRRKAHQCGMSHKIHVLCAKGVDALRTLSYVNEVDFVFIDADKPNYLNYMLAVLPMLRVGGVVCADNTLAWGEIANPNSEFEPHNVQALQEYNRSVVQHPQLKSSLVPLGDGMTMSIKNF